MQKIENMLQYIQNGGKIISSEIKEEYLDQILQKLVENNIEYLTKKDENKSSYLICVKKSSQNIFLDIQKEIYDYPYSIEHKKSKNIAIFHGTDHEIKIPEFGKGSPDSDYGQGFYTTEDINQADIWAITTGNPDNAIRNEYYFDLSGLNVVNLDEYGTLAWISEIAYNRGTRSELAKIAADILIDMYRVDTTNADVIIGYRADSIYMDIMNSFLEGELTVEETDNLFRKGELGEQIFIKSKEAFENIEFIKSVDCMRNKESIVSKEAQARKEVSKFLYQRHEDILHGYKPKGLTIDDVTSEKFIINKETGYYESEMKGMEI